MWKHMHAPMLKCPEGCRPTFSAFLGRLRVSVSGMCTYEQFRHGTILPVVDKKNGQMTVSVGAAA